MYLLQNYIDTNFGEFAHFIIADELIEKMKKEEEHEERVIHRLNNRPVHPFAAFI